MSDDDLYPFNVDALAAIAGVAFIGALQTHLKPTTNITATEAFNAAVEASHYAAFEAVMDVLDFAGSVPPSEDKEAFARICTVGTAAADRAQAEFFDEEEDSNLPRATHEAPGVLQ